MEAAEALRSPENGAVRMVWGVDPSTKRCAIATTRDGVLWSWDSVDFNHKLRAGERALQIVGGAQSLAYAMKKRVGTPSHVFIEQPAAFGRQVEPELYYAVAYIMYGIRSAMPSGVTVQTIPIGVWKRLTVGGAAKKFEYPGAAKRLGYPGNVADEADACLIAVGADRFLVEQEAEGEQLKMPVKGAALEPVEDVPRDLFGYWRTVFDLDTRTKFTPARRRKLEARLANYEPEFICRAIDGCAGSKFHRENGHIDLTLICRSDEKLEQFERMAAAPRKGTAGVVDTLTAIQESNP